MTNKKILQKAIEKAFPKDAEAMWNTLKADLLFGRHYYELIFSHAFAKAFWGILPVCNACERHHSSFSDCDCGVGNDMKEWQIRLRQMVLEREPLQYLAKFLGE